MALKRKFDVELDDCAPHNTKQLKLVPFPNMEVDEDVVMFDSSPLFSDTHHSRLSSNASTTSSNSSGSPNISPACYPTFDIYPMPFFNNEGSVNTKSPEEFSDYTRLPSTPSIGLLQPSSAFAHHGTGCSQVPKLRVACNPGLNGQRTMWSFCEQCGAISMVESD